MYFIFCFVARARVRALFFAEQVKERDTERVREINKKSACIRDGEIHEWIGSHQPTFKMDSTVHDKSTIYAFIFICRFRARLSAYLEANRSALSAGGMYVCMYACIIYACTSVHSFHTDAWFMPSMCKRVMSRVGNPFDSLLGRLHSIPSVEREIEQVRSCLILACITWSRNLVPLLEGTNVAQIHVDLSSRFCSSFCRIEPTTSRLIVLRSDQLS